MSLGTRLKEAREARGIGTIKELAEKTGVSEGTISRIESDQQDARAATLNLLNDILKINLNWLISGKEEMFITKIPHYESFKELLMRDYGLSDKGSKMLVEIIASNSKKDIIELWGDCVQGNKESIARLRDILRGLELANE